MAFGNLKKWYEGVSAQVNPFDGGKTFKSAFTQPTDASQIPSGYNFDRQPLNIPQGFGATNPPLPPGINTEMQNPLIMSRGELFPGQSMNFAYSDEELPQQLPYINYRY